MGLPFQQLRKLWLLYLFLLFFAFFMFAISINVYIQSLQTSELRRRIIEGKRSAQRWRAATTAKNVVAHYIGSGNIFGNLTNDEVNSISFNPVEGEGAEGRPVVIPPKDSLKMQRLFKLNSFNIMASDRIPLNRTLKDYRMIECRSLVYPADLPTTSVIIVFHNEAWSVLLRTIWSVINRTPEILLKEIILIDDASDRTYLQEPLQKYIATLPRKTHLFRMNNRKGLVPARLLGAKHATGDVLTFLDAHCECSEGWLEPLLARIKEDRTSVVSPVIDIISDNTFAYTKTLENHWGAFNWQLSFRWFAQERSSKIKRSHNVTTPSGTPAMAGGLFSIDRKYFYEIGSYDSNMKIWGGENVEMSFRVWQCGGKVEISPCSHVGHIFRKNTPYTFPGGVSDVLGSNLARVALVWMDEWKDFFLEYNAVATQVRDTLDVTDRLALRQKLKCKSFKWYLENIWPEHFFPAHDRFFGKIIWLDGESLCSKAYSNFLKNIPGRLISRDLGKVIREINNHAEKFMHLLDLDKDKCIRPGRAKLPRSTYHSAVVGDCTAHGNQQDRFVITPEGLIRTNDNVCLDYNEPKPLKAAAKLYKNKIASSVVSNVQLATCHTNARRQLWTYDMNTQQIIHQETKLCLTLKSATATATQARPKTKVSNVVVANECSDYNDITQMWGLVPLAWTMF